MKIAFFDAKPYDKPSFDKFGAEVGMEIKYFETKLNEDTAELANGYDAVCAFVNDTVDAKVIDKLCGMGIKVLVFSSDVPKLKNSLSNTGHCFIHSNTALFLSMAISPVDIISIFVLGPIPEK